MITTIILISLAFAWLGFETKWFSIRLPVGKDKPRNAGRTMAEWDIYNKEHAKELEQEQKEYARKQAERASHTCNICQKYDETMTVETREIKAGNSICHVKGCPECIAKFTKDIEKSQTDKIRQSVIKTSNQLPLFEYKHNARIGSHTEWTRWNHETQEFEHSDKYIKGYSKRVVEEFETVYHDCLVSKEWLKEHEKFEYPEATIDITIDNKTLPVNGNYKKGLIAGFMENYTERVKAGKKTVTVLKGGHVENMGGGCYVAVNEPTTEELAELVGV
jgi:head-tail adaptor